MNAFAHVKYAARTDVGRKRKNNEDAFGVFPESGLFCVADGMGGGDDGEIASAAVVKSVGAFAASHKAPVGVGYPADEVAAGVTAAVNEASSWICSRAAERKQSGCGSTFVGIVLDATAPADAMALHAGDSRLYRVRGAAIKQITKDHSAAEMIGAKDESALNPRFRGVILRAVGVRPSVDVERTPLPLKDGDRIVICSDGLSKMVDDRDIAAMVRKGTSPEAVADALISAANDAGGADNVTAVVLFVGKLPLARPSVSMALPESQTSTTEDVGDPDTSNTGSGEDFELEPDTADDTQTMNTITMRPQSFGPSDGVLRQRPARPPLSIRPAARPDRRSSSRSVRLVAIAIVVGLASLLVVLCAVHLVRSAKARGEARAAERQRSVQTLAAANASAAAVQNRESAEPPPDSTDAIVKTVEQDLLQSQAADDKVLPDDKWEKEVLPALVAACSATNSDAFFEIVRKRANVGAAGSLKNRLPRICSAECSIKERRNTAGSMTEDVQDIAKALVSYSSNQVAKIDKTCSDHTTRSELKKQRLAERKGLVEFMAKAEKFVAMSPLSPDSQKLCADIMLGVVEWFRQDN